ncbi:MATE family efflux transporter, partial [bacterium]|nr:MATE family efflux transporter [bacterium]
MPITKNNLIQYLKELLVLAIPLFIGNLGHTLIGAADVFVVARYNIDSLAAISIANSVIFTIFILGIGIITAISIILSHKRGENKTIKKYLPSTLVFSLILSILFTIFCYITKYTIPHLGIENTLTPFVQEYISIVAFSMFGIFFFEGIKQFLQSYEIVKIPNMILLLTVFLNLFLDIVFVFGFGIIPAMGSKGAAIATLITRTFMGLVLFIYIFKYINWKEIIDVSYMKNIIKIGLPIGIALVFEFLAFNIITILIAREEGILAAVHSILITIASATYMIPMSLATAISVKVAFYYGAKQPDEIKLYSIVT